jgi:CRP/FNR family cyclic AMP-dependent transcriptional regulator
VVDGPKLLEQLSDEDRRRVLSNAPRRRFARGEVIFHEGDPGEVVHVIAKGHVAVRGTTRLGDVATFRVLGAGDIFGEQALLVADARRVATIAAIDVVETQSIHRHDFATLRAEHPQIDRFLVEALVLQVRRLSVHLQEALFVPSETRVLRRLLELCDTFRNSDDVIVVPLTQDDLASMAGTSRPTANRILKAAEADGALQVGRGKVEVLDPDALARLAR